MSIPTVILIMDRFLSGFTEEVGSSGSTRQKLLATTTIGKTVYSLHNNGKQRCYARQQSKWIWLLIMK
jgi:hypothetical protein